MAQLKRKLASTTGGALFQKLALACFIAANTLTANALPVAGEQVTIAARSVEGGRIEWAPRNRPGLLLLWSPESLASRKSVGEIQRFATSQHAARVEFLTIAVGATPEGLREFFTARRLSFPVALRGEDNLGRINEDHLPIALLVDGNGRVVRQRSGLIDLKRLVELLDTTD